MPTPVLPRAAAVSAGLLATANAYQSWLQTETTAYLSVLTGFAAIFGLIASARLWWGNCPESRFVTASIALGTLSGHLLVAVVGLPGQGHPLPPTAVEITTVALSCLTLLLLTLSSPRTRLRPRQRRRLHGLNA